MINYWVFGSYEAVGGGGAGDVGGFSRLLFLGNSRRLLEYGSSPRSYNISKLGDGSLGG